MCSSVISGQLSVPLPWCPALHIAALFLFNCFIEQKNDDDADDDDDDDEIKR